MGGERYSTAASLRGGRTSGGLAPPGPSLTLPAPVGRAAATAASAAGDGVMSGNAVTSGASGGLPAASSRNRYSRATPTTHTSEPATASRNLIVLLTIPGSFRESASGGREPPVSCRRKNQG